jgi:hypothetical protein
MPSNLPVAGYNDGGIVAFAEGGDAEDFDYEEYQDEQEADEYNNVLRAYMEQVEAAGLEGIPIHNTKKVAMGVEKKANGGIIGLNAGGAIRFQSRGLVGDLDVLEQMRIEDPEGYARMMREVPVAPASHANYVAPRLTVEDEVAMNDPMVDLGMGIPTDVRMPSTGLNANDSQRSPTTLPTVVVTPERETVNPEVLGSEFGAQGILTPFKAPAGPGGGVDSARGSSNIVSGNTPSQGTVRERPKSAFEDFIANIKEERAALGKQKQDDKYMALLTAGLGMMSGTSPNAFANIGQGAQAGVAQYGASAKQRAAERAALNKNLLMGQRYQSMEDIAGRTADINEARYKDALAARIAGAGSSTKAEDQTRKQIADYGRLAETRFRTLSANAQKANQYTDPKGYAAAQNALTNDPELIKYNNIVTRLTNKLYGLSDDTESQNPPAPTNRPPLSSFNR